MGEFGLRSVAAVIVLLGLATFDLGPRASASFRTTLCSNASAGGVDGACETSDVGPLPTTWPPARANHLFLERALVGLGESGGAGVPAPVTGVGSGAGQTAALDRVEFDINLGCERFRIAEIKCVVCGLITSVFEPPRVVV